MVAYCLAIIAGATGVVHFAVAGDHFQEYWLFGMFMLIVAWLQVLWAVAAVVQPSRMLWWLGGIVNAGIVLVYIVTRTVGDIVGPTPTAVEPVGFGDAACTLGEVLVFVGCAWLVFTARDHPVGRDRLVGTCTTVAIFTATTLSISLVAGGPDMVMTTKGASPATTSPSTVGTGSSINAAATSVVGGTTGPMGEGRSARA